jgi:hypothetical protein
MAISREQVEKLRAALKTAPEAPARSVNTTKQEAVRLLSGEIQTLQRRGYTLEQVAELLKGEGFVLTTPTLKSYLARAKASRKHRVGEKAKVGGAAKAPPPTAIASGVSTPEAGSGEKKETTTATPSTARAAPRSADDGGESGSWPAASGEAAGGSKLRSGKDAFLVKDKDHY